MLRGGTTTMQTFTTTAKTATDVFFDEASKRNMRVIAGVTGVDHSEYKGQAPNGYEDTADTFFEDSVDMYNKWHGKGRNLYAVSPRYAPGSTNEQLAKAGYLFKTLPGVYMNTHMAEVMAEVVEIKKLFPNATDYYGAGGGGLPLSLLLLPLLPLLPYAPHARVCVRGAHQAPLIVSFPSTDCAPPPPRIHPPLFPPPGVYQMHNLTGPRSTFGHSIYLTDSEFERIKKDGSSLAFCPASNLFLGSGLFKLAQAKGTKTPVRVSLGSDVAGGDTFSQLKVRTQAAGGGGRHR
jgi:cytosine/adenosine deaminase-related metal-dependent hydrolase